MSRIVAAVALLLLAYDALAMGGGASPQSLTNPDYLEAEKLVKAEKYDQAIPLLEKVVKAEPKNADAYNYLGYGLRKTGKTDQALEHYLTALKLEPEHRGANEYLGELYLMKDDLKKAEERLAVLDKACFFGCREFTELKNAIAEYKKKKGLSS
jgi:Flp pilus assembly protein TadD